MGATSWVGVDFPIIVWNGPTAASRTTAPRPPPAAPHTTNPNRPRTVFPKEHPMKLRLTLALLCCVAAAPAARAQGDQAKKRDIAFVKALQQKNGGFLPAPQDPKSNK